MYESQEIWGYLKFKKFVLGINKYAVFLRRGGCGSNLFFIFLHEFLIFASIFVVE
jgi:hypothetical protein